MLRWLLVLAVAGGLLPGCTHACTAMGCVGTAPALPLVDDQGQPIYTRGEIRTSQLGLDTAQPFDCLPSDARPDVCPNGTVLPPFFELRPEDTVDIRFELSDGTWSAWQPVDVRLTKHTDPDFNGPDCPCTWYTSTVDPIVVPANARVE